MRSPPPEVVVSRYELLQSNVQPCQIVEAYGSEKVPRT